MSISALIFFVIAVMVTTSFKIVSSFFWRALTFSIDNFTMAKKKEVVIMAVSKAQRLAQQKYNDKNYDRVAILIKKGKRDEYKEAAAQRGLGYAEMIRRAIDEYIANHAPIKKE